MADHRIPLLTALWIASIRGDPRPITPEEGVMLLEIADELRRLREAKAKAKGEGK